MQKIFCVDFNSQLLIWEKFLSKNAAKKSPQELALNNQQEVNSAFRYYAIAAWCQRKLKDTKLKNLEIKIGLFSVKLFLKKITKCKPIAQSAITVCDTKISRALILE